MKQAEIGEGQYPALARGRDVQTHDELVGGKVDRGQGREREKENVQWMLQERSLQQEHKHLLPTVSKYETGGR